MYKYNELYGDNRAKLLIEGIIGQDVKGSLLNVIISGYTG
jgi:hypothetical protein